MGDLAAMVSFMVYCDYIFNLHLSNLLLLVWSNLGDDILLQSIVLRNPSDQSSIKLIWFGLSLKILWKLWFAYHILGTFFIFNNDRGGCFKDETGSVGKKAMTAKNRLIIFGRYPVVGQTKTRLIPVLGPVGAADFQRDLTERVLQTALSAAWSVPFDLEFCFHGNSLANVRRWLDSDEIDFAHQCDGDLGQRMYSAMARAFDQGYQRVVLAGTDVPDLSESHLAQAFQVLADQDLVFGPSTDGGYWLVGARRKIDIFTGLKWSHADVLRDTLAMARGKGWSAFCLAPLTDMDALSDLKVWQPGRNWRRPYLSVVIPVLNEAGRLRHTIASAVCEDSEVIAVDGGSTDASKDVAEKAGAKVVCAPKGRAVQQNFGAQAARGKVLLFLHADTLLPEGFVVRIFEALLDVNVVMGAFKLKTDWERVGMRFIEMAANLRSSVFQLPYGDQGLFMTRETFEVLGGFPEVPIAEDLFLVRHAGRLGKIRTLGEAVVTSGRRWKKSGILKTTAANYLVAAGCLMGKSPHRLARLYRTWTRAR